MAKESHATLTDLYVVGIVKPKTNDPILLKKNSINICSKIMKKAKIKAAKKGILLFDSVLW